VQSFNESRFKPLHENKFNFSVVAKKKYSDVLKLSEAVFPSYQKDNDKRSRIKLDGYHLKCYDFDVFLKYKLINVLIAALKQVINYIVHFSLVYAGLIPKNENWFNKSTR